MKKNYTILVVGCMLSALPFMAAAQSPGAQIPRTAQRGEIRANNIKLKQEIRDIRASSTNEIKDIKERERQDINVARNDIRGVELKNKVNNTVSMLTATADRLDAIITRIESRDAKIKEAKGNTTKIESEITLAKTDMINARTHINVISSIDLSGASTTVKANFEKVKSETKIVKDLFDKVRKELDKINKDLRQLGKQKKVPDETPKTRDNTATTTQ